MPFWWRPDGHGSAADAPSAQYEPATHSKHAVSPDASWYLPAAHLAHEPCSVLGCTVPGLHAVGSAAPVEQKAPAGHATQSSTLVIDRLSAVIVPFWWRPDGHGSAADAPASQYEPVTHTKHAVSPCPCWYLPATQAVQLSEPAAGATVPAGQGEGAVEPARHMLPAGQGWQPDWEGRPDSLP